MSKYDDRIDEIEHEILHAKGLRDAQEDGDADWREYQQQAKDWTRLLTAYKQAAPQMEQLDQRELELTIRLRAIRREWSSRESGVATAGHLAWAAAAVLGGLAWLTPLGVGTVVLAVLLAAGAAGSRLVIGWLRQRATQEQSGYQAELAALRDARRRLHPEHTTATEADTSPEGDGDGWARDLRAV